MLSKKRDLLGLKDLSVEDINQILHSAETMRYVVEQPMKRAPHLLGKSVVGMFYNDSTRTKMSFMLAAKYMQGTITTIADDPENSREGLVDAAKAVDRMGIDTIILRHPMSGAANIVAANVDACVINAGDGQNEHPTQALVDMFTIRQKFGKIQGLKVAIVGDILHSRVAKSNIFGLTKLGAEVAVGGPATLIPPGLESLGVKTCSFVQEALFDADVVIVVRLKTDAVNERNIPSQAEYAKLFCLNESRMQFAKKEAVILHSGPVLPDIEIASSLISSKQSLIGEQVTNGIAVRMAVLHKYSKRAGPAEQI